MIIKLKMLFFWVVTPHGLVGRCQYFTGTAMKKKKVSSPK
jgi:hypothetical protein